MRRDLGLIRELLLLVEELDIPAGCKALHYVCEEGISVEGHTNDAVAHHLIWLIEAGYIEGEFQNGDFVIERLSWAGCEFIDTVRDPEIWSTAKDGAKKRSVRGLLEFWPTSPKRRS